MSMGGHPGPSKEDNSTGVGIAHEGLSKAGAAKNHIK
jgi:hypothetical protein